MEHPVDVLRPMSARGARWFTGAWTRLHQHYSMGAISYEQSREKIREAADRAERAWHDEGTGL